MNHDDHQPDLSSLIDPELEARIVAWVSGEASPFEAAELTRLTHEKPELAIFKRRIETVRGLVSEAVRPDQEPLRLSSERRAKLLQAFGATENQTSAAKPANTVALPTAATKKHWMNQGWMLGSAASVAIGLFTVFLFKGVDGAFSISEGKMKPLASAQASYSENEAADRYDYDRKAAADSEMRREVETRDFAMADKSSRQQEAKKEAAAYKQKMDFDEKRKRESVAIEQSQNRRQTYGLTTGSAPTAPGTPPPPAVNIWAPEASRMQQVDDVIRSRRVQRAALAQQSPPAISPPFSSPTDKGGSLSAAARPSEEQIVLSPFAIEAKDDTGYAAKNTLAGTRLRTDLKDIGSAITVVSDRFLKDTGASNNRDVLSYTTNTEMGGTKGNFSAPLANEPSVVADGYNNALAVAGMAEPHTSIRASYESGDLNKNLLAAGRDSQAGKEIDAISADLPPEKVKLPEPAQTFSEVNANKEPVSTFSLHVSDVSFRLAQAALAKGEMPDRASIRPEEFYNAFSYGDPTPTLAEKVSCRIEQAAHPFVQQRNLVRIAVKVASSGRDAAQPLHLTVLLDTSGSMEREDRVAIIQNAMQALTSLLGANDRLTLIGFSRQPRLLAESLPGDQASQALDLIKNTPSEGGTNLEEALKLGSELAHRQFETGAQNRIVLLTDGAANLGNANPTQLAASVEALRQQGIAFDACGVGLEGLDDNMLENLTRKGDGRYYVLNSPEAADAGFAKQLAGAFRPAAENVKLQVRFNPARVGHYRLIGFEQHRLKEEDFRNDKVDAAELAAEEAAVAVYQVEALPQGEGELGEVYVRFRDASSGIMVERNWTLNYDAQAPAFDRATPSIQLAGTAALFAEKLQGGEPANAISLKDLAPVVNKLRSHYAHEARVQELATMFEQARKLTGE